ncbi:MAG: MBL fold metallo-hydrolase [Actinobacteria bacterium]|nr:MBL fold metallo-hydrolase [Actinomycetota bacterium]
MTAADRTSQPLTMGRWQITPLRDAFGPFLDAATVFPMLDASELTRLLDRHGESYADPSRTRLNVASQGYLIRRPGRTIIVDTCVGGPKPDRQPPMPGFVSRWLDQLEQAGVTVAEVDTVVTTHLHHDHVGWNTTLTPDGRLRPTFPNARYLLGRTEHGYLTSPAARAMLDRVGDYLTDSVTPIAEAGQLDLVDGDHQIDEGITYRLAPGHTPGHRIVEVTDGGRTALLVGDLVHHPLQIERPEISTAMCVAPAEAAATRVGLLGRAARDRALVLASHLLHPVRVRVRTGGFDYDVEASVASYGP